MTNRDKDKVDRMMAWFKYLNSEQKDEVARHLFEHAVISEWVSIRSEEDARECAEESGVSIEKYLGPYFSTCGEPLLKHNEE